MQFCCNFLRAADPFLLGFLLPGAQSQPNLAKIYIRKIHNSLNIILILGSGLASYMFFSMLLLIMADHGRMLIMRLVRLERYCGSGKVGNVGFPSDSGMTP